MKTKSTFKSNVKIQNSKFVFTIYFCVLALSLCVSVENLFAQSGGTFDLSHAVIAAGGSSNAADGAFRVDATVGQPSAGTMSSGATFDLQGGFWAFRQLTPTAALVSISGRVTTANGQGIRNARLRLTGTDGSIRSAITGTFGYYRFDEIEVGHAYILEIFSKRYAFADPTRVITLQDEVTDIDFMATAN